MWGEGSLEEGLPSSCDADPSQTGKSEEGEEKSGEQRDLVLFSHSQTLSERMFTNTPQVVPILRSLAADGVQCVQPLFELDGDLAPVYTHEKNCLLYTSPSPRDGLLSRMPSSA